MLRNFGATELIIILVIIVLIFGVGRLTKIGGEIGGAIKSFRKGLKDDEIPETMDDDKKE